MTRHPQSAWKVPTASLLRNRYFASTSWPGEDFRLHFSLGQGFRRIFPWTPLLLCLVRPTMPPTLSVHPILRMLERFQQRLLFWSVHVRYVCHLRLKRWRLNKNIVRFDKKGFLNMHWVPFWKKSSENLLKWYHIYWLTLWNLIKNGHSREWMWYCYLACPKLENRVFQDMHGRISKDHGRRNGKIVF